MPTQIAVNKIYLLLGTGTTPISTYNLYQNLAQTQYPTPKINLASNPLQSSFQGNSKYFIKIRSICK